MVAIKGTPTRFSNFIHARLMESPLSQKEIAEAVGYKNPNMITMLKQGQVKLALDRVPEMAKVLNMDALELFKIALTQFYDEAAVRAITEVIDGSLTKAEKRAMQIMRGPTGKPMRELTPEQEERLKEIFS